MIRATTGGVLRGYRSNLMNSFIRDNKARDTVLSQRVFNSYAEDPASAAKAFRLRKSRLMASSQLKICDNTYHKYQAAFASLQSVSELIDTSNSSSSVSTLKSTTLKMLNDPTGDARTQLNRVLDNLDDTIIQMMNQTYGDEFIFAGADGFNVPFSIKEEDGVKRLYYRGVPVDASEPNIWKATDEDGNFLEVDQDGTYPPVAGGGYYLKMDNVTIMSQKEYDKLYSVPVVEQEQMKDDDGNVIGTLFKEYNKDGTEKINEDDEGGYYKRVDFTEDDTDGLGLISIRDYDAIVKRSENPPSLQNGDSGNLQVDKDGNLIGDGPADENTEVYFLVFDGEPQTISKENYEQDVLDYEKLKYLANGEKRFVDIGLGFQEDENGNLIETSAFNECLSGLTFLGYGLDEDGDPKNIYSIVQRLKEIATSVPDGTDWGKELYNEFDRLVGKLEGASSEFKTQFTNQSAGTEKLKYSYDLLEENVYSLKEQYSNLEDVNMADAISSFLWAEYCYNAALKVGNSVLSQSLMDYLS